jgi:hypothetical protein|tara:strand:- start:158 stop:316 length:159 start_codon:yes stop_codon:yes gene_type:complete
MVKNKDFFGFNKAINWDKLKDPKVLKELEKIFNEEKQQATSNKQGGLNNEKN